MIYKSSEGNFYNEVSMEVPPFPFLPSFCQEADLTTWLPDHKYSASNPGKW